MRRPTAAEAVASTGHRIIVDRDATPDRRWIVELEGPLDTMQYVPNEEIEAVCAAAGVRCLNEWRETWSPCEVL